MHIGHAVQRQPLELAWESPRRYGDPFNEVELDVVFTAGRRSWRVPAYWAGGSEWRIRFAPPQPGKYRFETVCSDASNSALHGLTGTLEASPYAGDNPLLARGAPRVSRDRRHFEHADGTPFFWLGDTWWMGFTKRLAWPEDFQLLAADRVEKGFSVVQIVAGLYPDMPAFDPRGANEAGLAWERRFTRVNPAWFDLADLRVQWLVRSGLVPCIVGCWGYYLPWMGVEKMKRHWRYIIARWGAYPVVWCLAGEAAMPYYGHVFGPKSGARKAARAKAQQKAGWTELGRYVRRTDPYGRLVTIHPTDLGRDQVNDDAVLDFDMLQTGHGGRDSVANTIRSLTAERRRKRTMPVLVGEVSYEGIMHGCNDEIQRLTFWACMLSGAAGHTYGANGIWQVNTRAEPFGPSPHGGCWGNQPWEEAYRLAGSRQLGLAKRLLERFEWWRFKPHPEWIAPAASEKDYFLPYAAGIPGEVRVFYWWHPAAPWSKPMKVRRIEPGVRYRAMFFDPRTGAEHRLGVVKPDARGAWAVPIQPEMSDWAMVMEARSSRRA